MIGPAVRRLLVGGYTDKPLDGVGPRGLVEIVHDLSSGSLSQRGPALELPSPSYLLRRPGAPLVYAVSETEPGAVSAIQIGSRLQVMSTLAIPGRLPCHLCLSPDLGHLLVANYGSGDVVALRLGDDGVPQEVTAVFSSYGQGPHPRQEGPHAPTFSRVRTAHTGWSISALMWSDACTWAQMASCLKVNPWSRYPPGPVPVRSGSPKTAELPTYWGS